MNFNIAFAVSLMLSGCVAGPRYLGPEGGRAGARDGDCNAIVDVPGGALDAEYAIYISCEEAESTPFGLLARSPLYRFNPVDLRLALPALFDLEFFEGEGELYVGWSAEEEGEQWELLTEGLTMRNWSDGTPVIRFEHDAFGLFVLVSETSG